eukprot:CAMPEP_0202858242 /NCGR_PEP_ID=MMETSP1391-20130828/858_1 /ASSEMBLY_ACC=CAM_ASM_000867 /TAXON_ID=1034604 /ORGANISM="Chlamydomonas leiostraca, Strain SAG 11-49" /LENGTH=478 /DNA_ID=CAMNT_0049537139 /DNA_START=80 /DNA_END=1516 /DNA_ORIENTATION=+
MTTLVSAAENKVVNPWDALPPELLALVLVKTRLAPGHLPQQVSSSWKQAVEHPDHTAAWLVHTNGQSLMQFTLLKAAGCTRQDSAALMQRVLEAYRPQLTKPLSSSNLWDRWHRAGLLCGALDKAAGMCRVDTWLQLMQHVPAASGLRCTDALAWNAWLRDRLSPMLVAAARQGDAAACSELLRASLPFTSYDPNEAAAVADYEQQSHGDHMHPFIQPLCAAATAAAEAGHHELAAHLLVQQMPEMAATMTGNTTLARAGTTVLSAAVMAADIDTCHMLLSGYPVSAVITAIVITNVMCDAAAPDAVLPALIEHLPEGLSAAVWERLLPRVAARAVLSGDQGLQALGALMSAPQLSQIPLPQQVHVIVQRTSHCKYVTESLYKMFVVKLLHEGSDAAVQMSLQHHGLTQALAQLQVETLQSIISEGMPGDEASARARRVLVAYAEACRLQQADACAGMKELVGWLQQGGNATGMDQQG